MPLTFAAIAAKISAPIAKFLLKCYLGEAASAAAEGLVDIASSKIEDEADQRLAARVFEDIADKIVGRLMPLFQEVNSSAAESVAIELGNAVGSKISAEFFVDHDLDPAKVASSVRASYKVAPGMFSDDETELYERALDETIRYIAATATSLPQFELQSTKAALGRLSRIGNDVETVLEKVSKIERRLSKLSDNGMGDDNRFEADYRQAVVNGLDYLELFGADISPEAQRHSLTVGYVSLELSGQTTSDKLETYRANDIFAVLREKGGRLIIRGHAGGGKSTLLRWIAIKAALGSPSLSRDVEMFDFKGFSLDHKFPLVHLKSLKSSASDLKSRLPITPVVPLDLFEAKVVSKGFISHRSTLSVRSSWQYDMIPFLIRLRDCKKGQLPSPEELPLLISKAIGKPPENWVRQKLLAGRGLLLIDGIDEISVANRSIVRVEIEAYIRSYPKSWIIVTTRPTAIPEGWLSACHFAEAAVTPMTPIDRIEFIKSWHKAVSNELERQGKYVDLTILADELISKLPDNPAIARLATNPLLCAVICALHRDRNKKLPESQSELCEAMCNLLIHRREVEAELPTNEFPEEYRILSYEQKRSIVQAIAFFMVRNEESSISEADALSETKETLDRFPVVGKGNAAIVLRAIVERSGVLREQKPGTIDFIHNTIKEYLSAEVFVEKRDAPLLARHAGDDLWQPIILFACATRDRDFASRLVEKILSLADEKEEPLARRLRLTAVGCRSAALHMDPPLMSRLQDIERRLVPPKNMSDAEALASGGDMVVRLLWQRKMGAREAAACIRTLRLVGTPSAHRCIDSYLKDSRQQVVAELCRAVNPLRIDSVKAMIVNGQSLPGDVARQINDLAPLVSYPPVQNLKLIGVSARDIRPLRHLETLKSIELYFSSVSSLGALSGLPLLEKIDASFSSLEDVGPLQDLPRLKELDVSFTSIFGLDQIGELPCLTNLDCGNTPIINLGFLSKLPSLTRLLLDDCGAIDWRSTSQSESLQTLSVTNGLGFSLNVLDNFKNLSTLDLTDTEFLGKPAGGISSLVDLKVTCIESANLDWILELPSLERIKLSNFNPTLWPNIVSKLKSVSNVSLKIQSASHIRLLQHVSTLASFGFVNRDVDDISGITAFQDLKFLAISGFVDADMRIVESLPRLEQLTVDGLTELSAIALARLPNIKEVTSTSPWPKEIRAILGAKTKTDPPF